MSPRQKCSARVLDPSVSDSWDRLEKGSARVLDPSPGDTRLFRQHRRMPVEQQPLLRYQLTGGVELSRSHLLERKVVVGWYGAQGNEPRVPPWDGS